tara:strand:+ start:8183 stop:8602 length:420 start_codon:yes stop_codon:yes gene_type:complete
MSYRLRASDILNEQRSREKKKIRCYKKVLDKCYNRIKFISKRKEMFCFYVVPNYILGEPLYDINTCIIYVMEKLINSGFHVKYTHPNLLFISWNNEESYEPINNNTPSKYFEDGSSITYKSVEQYRPKKIIYDLPSIGD